jgi:hypothetical protein
MSDIARRDQVAALAARYALPAIYTLPEQAEAGGLMSYGASQADAYRQAAFLRVKSPAIYRPCFPPSSNLSSI